METHKKLDCGGDLEGRGGGLFGSWSTEALVLVSSLHSGRRVTRTQFRYKHINRIRQPGAQAWSPSYLGRPGQEDYEFKVSLGNFQGP